MLVVGIMILVWLYGTGVVLDGNSFKWKNSYQAPEMMKVRGPEVHSSKGVTRKYPDQQVRAYPQILRLEGAVPQFTHSNAEKCALVGFLMFSAWYLSHRS